MGIEYYRFYILKNYLSTRSEYMREKRKIIRINLIAYIICLLSICLFVFLQQGDKVFVK